MYMTYGEAVNADEMSRNRFLAEGLALGCVMKKPVAKDQVLTYYDVELPVGRLADELRAEQLRHFRQEKWLDQFLPNTLTYARRQAAAAESSRWGYIEDVEITYSVVPTLCCFGFHGESSGSASLARAPLDIPIQGSRWHFS